MSPAFWFTIQVGTLRVPVPLLLFLPLALLVDTLAMVVLLVVAQVKRQALFLRLATAFALSRLTLALLLHGGGLRLRVRDGRQRVSIHGGW